MKTSLSFHSYFRNKNQNYGSDKRDKRHIFTPKKKSNNNLNKRQIITPKKESNNNLNLKKKKINNYQNNFKRVNPNNQLRESSDFIINKNREQYHQNINKYNNNRINDYLLNSAKNKNDYNNNLKDNIYIKQSMDKFLNKNINNDRKYSFNKDKKNYKYFLKIPNNNENIHNNDYLLKYAKRNINDNYSLDTKLIINDNKLNILKDNNPSNKQRINKRFESFPEYKKKGY